MTSGGTAAQVEKRATRIETASDLQRALELDPRARFKLSGGRIKTQGAFARCFSKLFSSRSAVAPGSTGRPPRPSARPPRPCPWTAARTPAASRS